MKYAVASLLVVHGLIHLIGFAKAFDWAQPPQMQASISRSMGLVWLTTALLLTVSGGMLLMAGKWWWAPAAVGVTVSQLLIIVTWSDAKAGSIANALLLLPIVAAGLALAPGSFRATYDLEAAAGLRERSRQPELLQESDITHLPPAVRRYLEFVGAVGKPQVWNYRVRFRGALRSAPDSRWMPVTADQQSFVDPPGRLFLVEASMFGVPSTAFHRYIGSEATFRVKLASLLTVVNSYGAEMNQSETVTLLNDMFLLAPSTLIDPEIAWEVLTPQTARAIWTNAGNKVSAVVSFDHSGALVNFVSEDRYRTTDGKTFERRRWSTPVHEWRALDGRRLPASCEAIWDLPEGAFAYARFDELDVEYNVSPR